MRLQAFVVTVIMLATFFGCSEGPPESGPSVTGMAADVTAVEVATVEPQAICEGAARVWGSSDSIPLVQLRDATVELYQQAAMSGTAAQKRHLGSATTGVGTASALSLRAAGSREVDGRVVGALDRFEQAMVRLDADCGALGVDVVPATRPPSV